MKINDDVIKVIIEQAKMLTPVGRYSTSFPRRISTVLPRH